MGTKIGVALLCLGLTAAASAADRDVPSQTLRNPQLYYLDHFDVSRPLRDMPVLQADPLNEGDGLQPLKLVRPVREVRTGWVDPLESVSRDLAPTPAVGTIAGLSFDGVGVGLGAFTPSAAPPDTVGAPGATQYVQWVNTSFAVFDKSTGALVYGPAAGNTLWQGFGGPCETTNSGDPIVMYDKAAGRWVMTQFSVNPAASQFYQCVAVSTTSDATGTYRRFAYGFPGFNDYPKGGVWPDGYYLSFNIFNASSGAFEGALTCAFDRIQMISANGAPRPAQCFQLSPTFGALLPSDLDGATAPPAGSPNYFVAYDYATGAGLNLWRFHVDWTTPANSTFTGPASISGAAFTAACGGGTCIPQPSTTQQLDSLADRVMYRLAYRNFDTHESLVVNHSVAVGSTASGVRWYEVRNLDTTPTIFQSGTFSPDATSRWMGSIAQDRQGNMLMGYSVSSSTVRPGIRYTGRLATDRLGGMRAENTLTTGLGSQTGGLSRWGDYSAMTIDSDDCTFWYTTEYLQSDGSFNWSTRIGSFRFPGCVGTISAAERQALLDLYTSTGGSVFWTRRDNWGGPAGTECTWYGVTCDAGQTTITEIRLDNNGLFGRLPTSLSNLTGLMTLSLRSNFLGNGSIPSFAANTNLRYLDLGFIDAPGTNIPSFGANTNLEHLDLSNRSYNGGGFAGNIPSFAANTNLRYLNLSGNSLLTGTIPSFASNTNLQYLNLSSTGLTGGIPSFDANTNLQYLDLSGNGLTGSVPSFDANTNLQHLDLSSQRYFYDAGLTGSIPPFTTNASLQYLNLSANRLTGGIPGFAPNTSLQTLNLGSNQLTGEVPSFASNTNLQSLTLSGNPLTGNIPSFDTNTNLQYLGLNSDQLTGDIPSFAANVNLQSLHLSNNQLTGSVPSFTANVNLQSLHLGNNQLTSSIPAFDTNTNLLYLNLSSNQLTGSIPSFAANVALQSLYLGNNQLTGGVPSFEDNTNLWTLVLEHNQLTGSIPSFSTNLRLGQLNMGNNQLTGNIPSFEDNVSLTLLSLEHNQLTGSIPSFVGFVAYGDTRLDLSDNQLTGSVPSFPNFSDGYGNWLDLSNNQLTGSIPSSLGLGSGFGNQLDLSTNELTGSIPPSLGSGGLSRLALGNNQLTGSIPPGFGSTPGQLDLSNNQLTGSVPSLSGSYRQIDLSNNQLTGSAPLLSGNSNQFNLSKNQLTGSVPSSFGSFNQINLSNNQLTGSVPSIPAGSYIDRLDLSNNQLTGSVPSIPAGSYVDQLDLSNNQLTGSIPSSLADTVISRLHLNGNRLEGQIPTSLQDIRGLYEVDLRWNALYSTDAALIAFLNSRQVGGDWQGTQTIAPTEPSVTGVVSTQATVNWTPIAYAGNSGYYRVSYATTSGGPYTPFATVTQDKLASSLTVTGLSPSTPYYVVVQTTTLPHNNNANTVVSEYSVEVSTATPAGPQSVDVQRAPALVDTLVTNVEQSDETGSKK